MYTYRKYTPIFLFLCLNILFAIEYFIAVYFHFSFPIILRHEHISSIFFLSNIILSMLFIPMHGAKGVDKIIFEPWLNLKALASLLIAIGFIVVHYSFSGTTAIGTDYTIYSDNLEEGSGIIEYLIFLFVVIGTIKKSRAQNTFFIILLLFYIVKTAFLGFRVQSVMALFVLYLLVYRKNINPIASTLIAVVSYILLTYLGYLKDGLSLSGNLDLAYYSLLDNRNGYFQSHHMNVITSSSVALDHIDAFHDPISNLYAFVVANVMQPKFIKEFMSWIFVSYHINNIDSTPGGCYFPVSLYLLFGYIGVIAFGSFLVALIHRALASQRDNNSRIANSLFVILLVFSPRWVYYDLIIYATRPLLLILMALLILYIIRSSTGSKNKDTATLTNANRLSASSAQSTILANG